MRRSGAKSLVLVAVLALVFPVLGAPPAGSQTAAAELACARRDGWQRWYATPSKANVVGVWACGWYRSGAYDLEGTVWRTGPDVSGARLSVRWGDGTSTSVPASAEGQPFALTNPAGTGVPPLLAECTANGCGTSTRVDYLPERNKLAGVFRMMTYNIHHGYDYDNDICEGPPELWKTASTIRRNDPDIVVVNEINEYLIEVGGRSCTKVSQPWVLADSLDMNAVYCNDYYGGQGNTDCQTTMTGDVRNSGNAILSRYPITYRGHLVLTHRPTVEAAPRGVIWAEVTVNGTRIPVYGTHLAASCTVGPNCTQDQYNAKKALREAQLIDILRYMAANGHYPARTKMIFAGDLNTADVTGELWRLGREGRGFHDGFKWISPDWAGYTVPVKESRSQATARIDYIWTSPLFHHPARGTAVPWSQSSDHLPVIVDLDQ